MTYYLKCTPGTAIQNILFAVIAKQTKSIAIVLYYPGLTEKLKCFLSCHNIKTVTKPCNTIGNMLSKHKDVLDPNRRQGAIYQIPCKDCNDCYIGETKRSFEIRK